jgi:hypothetical protein
MGDLLHREADPLTGGPLHTRAARRQDCSSQARPCSPLGAKTHQKRLCRLLEASWRQTSPRDPSRPGKRPASPRAQERPSQLGRMEPKSVPRQPGPRRQTRRFLPVALFGRLRGTP